MDNLWGCIRPKSSPPSRFGIIYWGVGPWNKVQWNFNILHMHMQEQSPKKNGKMTLNNIDAWELIIRRTNKNPESTLFKNKTNVKYRTQRTVLEIYEIKNIKKITITMINNIPQHHRQDWEVRVLGCRQWGHGGGWRAATGIMILAANSIETKIIKIQWLNCTQREQSLPQGVGNVSKSFNDFASRKG